MSTPLSLFTTAIGNCFGFGLNWIKAKENITDNNITAIGASHNSLLLKYS